jgi:hypothetical protein
MKRITIILIVIILSSCDNSKAIKYSFFVAGHTYGKPGRTELGLCKVFKDKIDLINAVETMNFGVLTGDIVRHADKTSWDAIDNDIKKLKIPIHFSRGNHDGNLSFIEKRYGKTYKSFRTGNDMHIILDSNISEWNITGDQLSFLKSAISEKNIKNIFIYVHHIMWWNTKEYYMPFINSKDRMSKNLTFWSSLYPLLKSTNKPVFIFAGDVGAFDNKNPGYQSYSYVIKDNLTLITSGMGGGKKDNFLIIDVLNDDSVKFRLIHLNGNDINGLGKLEDYNPIIK